MRLELTHRMRPVALAVVLVGVAGCPATQNAPGDDQTPDAAPVTPDAPITPTCDNPVPSCQATVRYHDPNATAVELHGDFAADGWATGVAMMREGDDWVATLDGIADEQVIVYKLVVDGTWIADPANTRTSPDSYGGQNSVIRVDCDHCPHRPAIDWRD